MLKSFEKTKEYEGWKDWNSQVANFISKLYAEKGDWGNAYVYMRESVNWSDKLLNKQTLLGMIENRPNGEDDDPAMVYVTLINFIESAFAALPTSIDSTEESPDKPH